MAESQRVSQRDRWFLLGCAFLVLNAAAVASLRPWSHHAPRPRVTGFRPEPGSLLHHQEPLQWTFSRAMVPGDACGRWVSGVPVTLSPSVAGLFRWRSSRTLEFRPEQPWKDCSTFTARIEPELRDAEGRALSGRTEFAASTGALRLQSAVQSGVPAGRDVTLELKFSARVEAARAIGFVAARQGGRECELTVLGQGDTATILARVAALQDGALSLLVKSGLPAADGPLGMAADFATNITVSTRLEPAGILAESSSFADAAITANFTAPVSVERLRDFVAIDPAVPFSVAALPPWSGTGCTLTGAFEPGRRYSVTFRRGLPAVTGAPLAADFTRSVTIPDRPAALGFRDAGRYLSTRGSRQITITTVNVPKLTVQVERVYPNNLVYFATRASCYYPQTDLSQVIAERELRLPSRPNEVTETALDLGDLAGGQRTGALFLTVSAPSLSDAHHLVVFTDIGLTTKRTPANLLVWANSLRTLAPTTGAVVRAFSKTNQEVGRGLTDAEGLARLDGDFTGDSVPILVTVERGDELAYLELQGPSVDAGSAGAPYPRSALEAFLLTDRGVYRPGETTRVRAIVRGGSLLPPGRFPVVLRVIRPDGRRETELARPLGSFGTAEFELPWPAYAATGRYRLELRTPGADQPIGQHFLAVEEFVPPQLAVTADLSPARIASNLSVAVSAHYLFGAPAAGAPVDGHVWISSADFTPTNWPGFLFGDTEKDFSPLNMPLGATALDEQGHATFAMVLPSALRPPSALKAHCTVTVVEPSGRAVSCSAEQPADPYPFYVGLKRAEGGAVIRVRNEAAFRVAAVHPDGTPARECRRLRAIVRQVQWSTVLRANSAGGYDYCSERTLTPVEEADCDLADGEGRAAFTPQAPGDYLLTLRDDASDASASITVHAGSPDSAWLAWSRDQPDRAELVLDRETYQPGETAQLALKTPFSGRCLLTIETDRIVETRVFAITGTTTELSIPVTTNLAPNAHCVVSVIRPVEPGEVWGPHRAAGSVPLMLNAESRRLTVALEAPAEVRPGAKLTAHLQATDATGAGVPAEITVAAVDEGICRLTAFRTPDPFSFFTRRRGSGVSWFDAYGLLMPEPREATAGSRSDPGGDGGTGLSGRLNPINARRFRPVALWQAATLTDAGGHAEVEFTLPEFSGKLRLMAVAVATNRFGSGAAAVTVRRPLVVLSSLPRFLAPSDRCEATLRVFNHTGEAVQAAVAVAATGGIAISPSNQVLTLAAGAVGEARAVVTAPGQPGVCQVRMTVAAGAERYDETVELAVRPAASRAQAAGFGAVGAGERAEVRLPRSWLPGTEQQKLWCSGAPALKLAGGLQYLLRYPHGCLEQTTSSAFPLLHLADLAAAVASADIRAADTARYVEAGIHRLLSMQQVDGSFGYWPHSVGTYAWGTVYATHFLVEARRAGYRVPEEQLDQALRAVERQLAGGDGFTTAHAAWVLALAGRPPRGWMDRLRDQGGALETDTRAALAAAMAVAGQRREAAEVLSGAGVPPAGQEPQRQQSGTLRSQVRTLALLLESWLAIDPEHAAVPLLARRLEQDADRGGGWQTTQENAFALLALGNYARRLGSVRRPFEGRAVWREDGRTVEVPFSDATNTCFAPRAPADGSLIVTNAGPGTAYFFWEASGVPADGRLPEADSRLAIRRGWFDQHGRPLDPGDIAQGQLVVVKLTLDTRGETHANLAIEDLLPAGFEIENPNLATSAGAAPPWALAASTLPVQHAELRDDRLVLFAEPVCGTLSYCYAVRAVTPGRYIYPPVMAECMYDPTVRSVHGAGRLTVTREGKP